MYGDLRSKRFSYTLFGNSRDKIIHCELFGSPLVFFIILMFDDNREPVGLEVLIDIGHAHARCKQVEVPVQM